MRMVLLLMSNMRERLFSQLRPPRPLMPLPQLPLMPQLQSTDLPLLLMLALTKFHFTTNIYFALLFK
jgi:hypothetical protein